MIESYDAGGIVCCLESSKLDKEALFVSITHLIIPDDNPMAKKIRVYQKKRSIRLAIEDGKLGRAKRLAKKK